MRKRTVILAEITFEDDYDEEWNFIFEQNSDIVKDVLQDVLTEKLNGEAIVKIKKYRMERVKNE